MERPLRIRAARAMARPRVRDDQASFDLPGLFGRQSATDCSRGSNFYRCSLNDFAGCCSVDPCSMTDGCPDEEDDSDRKDGADDAAGSPTATTPPGPLPTHGVWISLPPTTDDQSMTSALTTVSTETTESGAVLPTDLDDMSRESDDNVDDNGGGGGGGGLPPGAIAGIVIGILVALLTLVVLVCLRRRRKRKVTAAHAVDVVPPPMDANDEKFLRSTDPSSAVTTTSSHPASHGDVFTAASSDGKFPSRAPTPSTLGGDPRHSAAAHSYVSSITTAAGSPPPGAPSFPAGIAPAGHGPALAEMDSVSTMRLSELPGPEPTPPSELPAGPAPMRGAGPGGPPGGLATVAENEPRSAGGLLRGTLNPTAGERSRQTYVTSWSQFERDSR